MTLALLCGLQLAGQTRTAAAQAPATPSEFEVKATYLYNFGKFVEWPQRLAAQDESFSICVLGQDPFGGTLDATLAGETLKGKRAIARRITRAQDAEQCRILFIGSSEEKSVPQILASISKMAVLTVSDLEDFTQRGGMVQFVLDDRRVRFELNPSAAANAGLTLSSQLLRVAKTIRRPPSGS